MFDHAAQRFAVVELDYDPDASPNFSDDGALLMVTDGQWGEDLTGNEYPTADHDRFRRHDRRRRR